ncbi:hypothetical protein MNBD_ALPHA02-6 [hydrothermal vent metagenome]|uniref:UDP-2,4-diacetamido-2,4, 6-trideoxy-beta-L-altropyranose hydrolase n=1 Tax=hydrothermal vent metagenome TaxID=652676 RepID=A0A3B0RR55_9ZZZZ
MAHLSDPIKLLIRLDADHNTGLGHAARTAELLRHIDHPLDIHICGTGAQLPLFFGEGITLHPLPDRISEVDKSDHFLRIAGDISAHILLIDHPNQSRETWQKYHGSPLPVIAIDDYGGDVQADLIFNGTILDDYHHYPLMAAKDHIFCGGDYALLNPVFGEVCHNPVQDNLLIVIGGGERARQWALALTGEHSPFQDRVTGPITMIVGGTFPDIDRLRTACAKLDISVQQNIRQSDLADLLARHRAALITGGMIVYETLASGCPAIIFPQEKNLIHEADWFAQKGCLVNLGYEGGMDMKLVGQQLAVLYKDQQRATNGRELIDGKGMIRAAREIDYFLSQRSRENT